MGKDRGGRGSMWSEVWELGRGGWFLGIMRVVVWGRMGDGCKVIFIKLLDDYCVLYCVEY